MLLSIRGSRGQQDEPENLSNVGRAESLLHSHLGTPGHIFAKGKLISCKRASSSTLWNLGIRSMLSIRDVYITGTQHLNTFYYSPRKSPQVQNRAILFSLLCVIFFFFFARKKVQQHTVVLASPCLVCWQCDQREGILLEGLEN